MRLNTRVMKETSINLKRTEQLREMMAASGKRLIVDNKRKIKKGVDFNG
ncbi:MAG: hypothetical protein ACE3JK_15590 [Sporolactobacillus sp.]